jgi:triosephosphate isomerase
MRQKIVAGNWKMNKTRDEGLALVSELSNMIADEVSGNVQVVLCPPSIYLAAVGKMIQSSGSIALGAQNCHQKASGAYTGEVSAAMLRSIGVQYVILGHSERRQYFAESNSLLKEKTDIALETGLTPVFCCGESLELREQGVYIDFVRNQLTESLFHLSNEQLKHLVIAYEPIWAIGTGKTASNAQAQEMHAALREHLASRYGQETAQEMRILYGGSVNASNAAELFASPDVDGGLVGGASLKSREFTDIVKAAAGNGKS